MGTEFDSPIGRRRMAEAAAASGPRRFTVPQGNETHEFHDDHFIEEPSSLTATEEKILQARKDRALGIDRLSPDAKKRVELISGIGRLTRDVDVGGMTFTLRTLKSKEMKEATLASVGLGLEIEVAFESRRQFISRALSKIDGNELLLILGNDSLETRLAFVDELDEVIISRLYDEYNLLSREATEKFGIKTPEQAAEVVEDIKK